MKLIQHPGYVGPRRRLREVMDDHRPGHMIFIIGPSGAGKTTMRHSVMQEMFGHPMYWGQGRIPAIEAFVTLPSKAYFSSRELAKKLADELHTPTLDWLLRDSTIDISVAAAIQSELAESAAVWGHLDLKRATEGERWAVFQKCVVARSCKYVSLDQVTALLVNHRDTSPADHTLHLMALAEATGTMFVMTGVHDASRLWAVHSELRRRVITVWVPPYSEKRSEDRISFLRLLKSLSGRYLLSKKDLLLMMFSDLLAATGGVIAELIELLDRAARLAAEQDSPRILKRHIEHSYYNDEELTTLWRDIDAFERAMAAGDVSKRSALIKARWAATGQQQESTE